MQSSSLSVAHIKEELTKSKELTHVHEDDKDVTSNLCLFASHSNQGFPFAENWLCESKIYNIH